MEIYCSDFWGVLHEKGSLNGPQLPISPSGAKALQNYDLGQNDHPREAWGLKLRPLTLIAIETGGPIN
eukprot:4640270-Pyramimonas_sp.AAC.1